MIQITLEKLELFVSPVVGENTERWRFLTAAVHLSYRVRDADSGHDLLILRGGASEGLPHVHILQRHCGTERPSVAI